MEPGTILRTLNSTHVFEKLMKSKQIIESAYEKSQRKISMLKRALDEERQQNKAFKNEISRIGELEEKVKQAHNLIEIKNNEIKKLTDKCNKLENHSDESDSDTWKQLYESTKYSKLSSRTDYLELSHSIQKLLEKFSDSLTLKPLMKKRKSKLQEMRNLVSTLNFEKLLFHVCETAYEIISFFEGSVGLASRDSDVYSSVFNQKY